MDRTKYFALPFMVQIPFTCSLVQMELENQQLKLANVKQTEQIVLLQDKLQCEFSQNKLKCFVTWKLSFSSFSI